MQAGNAIEVKNITKKFKIYYDKGSQLKERLLFRERNRYEERLVLKDISFSVKKGEAVGLIGHNGCGKSTTLKLLTRIMYPDSGTIEMKGRVSSLIELGAGFHPDMSGRENIYTNAAIFGLSRKEIDRRLEDIIDFSELEEFIDNPVRTYSSGMYMRLAFAVAINVDADILLIDEILAVGDVNFQAKCFNRLREIKAQGTTIVIVSHSTGQIEQICDRAIWINDGYVQAIGKSMAVVDQYLQYMNGKQIESLFNADKKRIEKEQQERELAEEKQGEESKEIEEEQEVGKEPVLEQQQEDVSVESAKSTQETTLNVPWAENALIKSQDGTTLYEQAMDYSVKHFGLGTALVTKAVMKNSSGQPTYVLEANKKFYIEINYEVKKPMDEIVLGMGFYTLDGAWIFGTNTLLGKLKVKCTKNKGKVVYIGEEMPLLSGKYILQVSVTDIDGTPLDFYRDYCHFDVVNSRRDAGIVYLENSWEISE